MVSVQPVNLAATPAAKSKFPSKNQYAGTVIGTGLAAGFGVLTLCTPLSKGARLSSAFKEFAKKLPFYAGAGFLVDYLNNRQRNITEKNAKNDKGNDYTKVNSGKKYGAIMGAVIPLVMRIFDKNAANVPLIGKIVGLPFMLLGMGTSALAGYGLGAAADKISNSHSVKEADKAA